MTTTYLLTVNSAETRGRHGTGFPGPEENWKTKSVLLEHSRTPTKGFSKTWTSWFYISGLERQVILTSYRCSTQKADNSARGYDVRYKASARQYHLFPQLTSWTPHLFQTRGGSQVNLTQLLNYPKMFPGTPLLHRLRRKQVNASLIRRMVPWGGMVRLAPQNTT